MASLFPALRLPPAHGNGFGLKQGIGQIAVTPKINWLRQRTMVFWVLKTSTIFLQAN